MGLEVVLANGVNILKIILVPFYSIQNMLLRVIGSASAVFASILNLIWGLTFGAIFAGLVVMTILYHRLTGWLVHSGIVVKIEKTYQQIPTLSSLLQWGVAAVPDMTSLISYVCKPIHNVKMKCQTALINPRLPSIYSCVRSLWKFVINLPSSFFAIKSSAQEEIAQEKCGTYHTGSSSDQGTEPESRRKNATEPEFVRNKELKDACNSKKQLFQPE